MRLLVCFLLLFSFSCEGFVSLKGKSSLKGKIAFSPLTVVAGSPPDAPSGLNVVEVNSGGVTIGWTDVANDTGYWVEYYDAGASSTWTVWPGQGSSGANPTAANAVTYFAATAESESGTQAGLSFIKFRVFSTNDYGSSGYSSEVQVPPSVMVGDLAALINVNDVELQWTDTGEYETGVYVFRSTNAGMSYSNIATLAPGTGTYSDINILMSFMASDLRYYIVIFNSGGNGPNSNTSMPVP